MIAANSLNATMWANKMDRNASEKCRVKSAKWKTLPATFHFALVTLHCTIPVPGSWPMTSRTAKDQVPIIDFSSAWATLGLTRFVPK